MANGCGTDLWVQIIDLLNGLLYIPSMYGVPYFYPESYRLLFGRRLDVGERANLVEGVAAFLRPIEGTGPSQSLKDVLV